MSYNVKLGWKISTQLSASSPNYSQATKLFNILTGKSLAKQIGGGVVLPFVPKVLAPTTNFHSALNKEKTEFGFVGKKFPFELSSAAFPFSSTSRLNVAARIYDGGEVVLDFEISEFEVDALPSLLRLRDFASYPHMVWLARWYLGAILTGNPGEVVANEPSTIPYLCVMPQINAAPINVYDAVEAVTGHRHPSEMLIKRVLEKNSDHQTVDSGFLLLDKEGIFFTFPALLKEPSKYSPERIFESASTSLEIAIATVNALCRTPQKPFDEVQLGLLKALISKPALAMPKSVSAQKCWSLLASEFRLADLLPLVDVNQAKREDAGQMGQSFALIMKGGGVKGLALAGAIIELQKVYSFNTYVGTSAGAIAAILLATGMPAQELKDLLYAKDFRDFIKEGFVSKLLNMLHKGWYSGLGFTIWMRNQVAERIERQGSVEMRDLPHRAIVYAASADRGPIVFDSRGDNGNCPADFAARCSMSIPWYFVPQTHHGRLVFDGGMLNNFPVKIFLDSNPHANFIALYLTSGASSVHVEKSLFGSLLDIITGRDERVTVNQYVNQTIAIDPSPIKTTDFALSVNEKEFLVLQGRTAALQFIYKKMPSQGLHQEIIRLSNKASALKEGIVNARKQKKNRLQWILAFTIFTFAAVAWQYSSHAESIEPQRSNFWTLLGK